MLKIYSIRDSKGEVYNTPFFQRTEGEARRNFMDLVNDEKSRIAKYPEDFHLYHIGEYNDTTGKIDALDTPQHIVDAVQCKQ